MKSRIVLFDLTKFILAFLVVNLHVESFVTGEPFSYLYYLGWYAVPVFIAMSFYFNGKYYMKGMSQAKFKSKLTRLLQPFLFWSAIGFLINRNLITAKYILRQLTMGTAVDAPLYYLLIVFWLSIGFYLVLKHVKDKRKLLSAVIIFSLIFESIGIKSTFTSMLPIQLEFFVARFVELIKYASLGIVLSEISIKEFVQSKSVILYIALAYTFFNPYRDSLVQPQNLTYSGLSQFISVSAIMFAIIYYASKYNFSVLRKVSFLGKYALGIYCLHSFFIDYFKTQQPQPGHLFLAIIITILTLMISHLIKSLSNNRLVSIVE